MKFSLVFAIVLATASAFSAHLEEEYKKKIFEKTDACIAESGIKIDELVKMRDIKEPASHNVKCFLLCVQKSVGLMSADGKLDKEGALKFFESIKEDDADAYKTVTELFSKCYDKLKDEADPCDTAINLRNCFIEEAKALGLPDLEFIH